MADENKKEETKEEKKDGAVEASEAPKTEAPANAPESFRILLGEKIGMTQIFTDDGECRSVTEVQAGPCRIMRVKTKDSADGYSAVVLAYGERSEKNLNKPDLGQFQAAGIGPARLIKEMRVADTKEFKKGQAVDLAGRFSAGDYVDVQGMSKGKGFAGVMKRHNFAGMPASHGSSDKERSPGSIASRRSLGRVLPGQRMAGHMGSEKVTVQKIEVVAVDVENHRVYLNGSVPGPKGSFVVIRETVKNIKRIRPKVSQSKKKSGFAGKVERAKEK